MHPHDKGWHEVNWTPTEYDDDKIAKVLMTIICVGVIVSYFWDVLS